MEPFTEIQLNREVVNASRAVTGQNHEHLG